MSFHPQMAYDATFHKSTRVLAEAGPAFEFTAENRARLDEILPEEIRCRLQSSLLRFDRKMKGFVSKDAQLYGVESRTSCPIRIPRDEKTLESISHRGLYPAGEGAGYAGGITSAACDGIRIADLIAEKISGRSFAAETRSI